MKTNVQITGTKKNEEKEAKRAFDFINGKVNPEIKKPEQLRMQAGYFKISGDGVFYTIQGEGITMGMPACFLRLHTCNLKCIWCDAWYTWNPNTNEFWTESKNWSIIETKNKIENEWGCVNPKIKKRLVITGGEPLLQKDRIDQLLKLLPDWNIEIETNGTIMPSNLQLKRCQFNCSPKLKNSGNPDHLRIKKEVLSELNKVNTMFKFVVMTKEDMEEIEQNFIYPIKIDTNKIVIMPQGISPLEVANNAQQIVELVKKKGYRLLDRLHINIWGAKRKV